MKNNTMSSPARKLWVWTALFFGLFAAVPSLSVHSISRFFLSFVLWTVIFGIGFYACWLGIRLHKRHKQEAVSAHSHRISSRMVFLIIFVMTILLEIPAILALWPGIYGADLPVQVGMFDGLINMSLHHPILHSFVGWLCIRTGEIFFHSANIGLFLYVFIVQVVFCCYALARAAQFLYHRKVPLWLLVLMNALLILSPFTQVLLCYTTKDIPYAAALLLFSIACADLLFPLPHEAAKTHAFRRAVVWGILMVMLRNQGIYIVLAVLILWVLVSWKSMRHKRNEQFAFMMVIVMAGGMLFGTWLPEVFSAEPGSKKEMLSVPIQQMAFAIKDNMENPGSVFTDEEQSKALGFFTEFDASVLDKFSADHAKDWFELEALKDNLSGFVSLYGTMLQKDLTGAVFTWADLIIPYFDFSKSPYTPMILNTSFETLAKTHDISASSKLPAYRDYLDQAVMDCSIKRGNFLSWLFDPSLCLYLMMFVLGYGIFFRNKLCVLISLFPLLYFLTILLGPVALLRYTFPYVLEWPWMAGCLWTAWHPAAKTAQ